MTLPFDEYELRARIFPALIISIPALVLVYCVAPVTRNPFSTAGVGTLIEAAVLYFLGRIARDRGIEQQKRLFDRWGGPPTTRILRHDNAHLDALTKARLKTTLQTTCGLTFPSEAEERSDPERADTVYNSAIKALLEQRRDKKRFGLIFNENCNYGFARNLYGIRWLGVSIAFICGFADGVMIRLHGFYFSWGISTVVSVTVFVLLIVYVNANFVKRSAEAYAVSLLRSCEPSGQRPT